MGRKLLHFFRTPVLSIQATRRLLGTVQNDLGIHGDELRTEWRFAVETAEQLTEEQLERLRWLLAETFEPENLAGQSFLDEYPTQLEVGPNLNFETAWSSTAVEICHRAGIEPITRMERFCRYGLPVKLSSAEEKHFLEPLYDRMTEKIYTEPIQNFAFGSVSEGKLTIPILEMGKEALTQASRDFGWAMDEQDIELWYDLFANELKRNPTKVEAGHIGGCNSEHCRHWFWNGDHVIDGVKQLRTLMEIAKAAWKRNPGNSLVAFDSNCSVIRGLRPVLALMPERPGYPSPMVAQSVFYHPSNSAETHNHPSGIQAFQGAATGTGGLLRDMFAMYLGSLLIATGAGYCVDNLKLGDFKRGFEDGWLPPANLVPPTEGIIQMSDGASYYGNCYGVPLIYGFSREFGMELAEGRRGWFKPVMYAVGAGMVDDHHLEPKVPEKGMLIVKIGGPSYRIGMGGGPASSMNAGDNAADLDFDSVQRAAPEVENPVYRVIRACVEMVKRNLIILIHDQGAVGNANVLTELLAALKKFKGGGVINLRSLPVADPTLSDYEIWLNESQEGMGLLVESSVYGDFEKICQLENCPCKVVGHVTGDGWVVLHDELDGDDEVKLPLDKILGKLPRKRYESSTIPFERQPLQILRDLTVPEAVEKVFSLLSVGSKKFLTRKVDRSVTGLVAQQQCVGPHHVTVSDYALVAESHFDVIGQAMSLGEQPITGLISPAAMARLAAAEALLQLAGVEISAIRDIRFSGNWMWPAKQPGEAARIFEAALALEEFQLACGCTEDGGKDSVSMSARNAIAPDGTKQTVHAPGQLVVGAYVTVKDLTRKVTPAMEADNALFYLDLSHRQRRLGGSALAQVLGQIGDDCPDIEDMPLLVRAVETVEELVGLGKVTAVHDTLHDGGLITTILEMGFAGNVGVRVNLDFGEDPRGLWSALFAQEAGLVIAVPRDDTTFVADRLKDREISFERIGSSLKEPVAEIKYLGQTVLCEDMPELYTLWEKLSSHLDARQANPECVEEELKVIGRPQPNPAYKLTFEPSRPWLVDETINDFLESLAVRPKVAILREEGSNGDREMAAAFLMAGFEPWDVNMNHLLEGLVTLDDFQMVAFVGGFSFADVLDAAKGWVAVSRFNHQLAEQFERFYHRPDTLSFGICNGEQFEPLLGWVPYHDLDDRVKPRFIRNESERFESGFASVKILPSPSIMLEGMEDSVLGVWYAHGEGRLHSEADMLEQIVKDKLAPVRYVDYDGEITATYPFNPNGSPLGIAALTSPDGRHLAMMPHPERTFQLWQWPWLPREWRDLLSSPWLRLFQNAYRWCSQH